MWRYFFLAFFISAVSTGLIVMLSRAKVGFLIGADVTEGPQKFHRGNIPRIGGVGIALALSVTLLVFFGVDGRWLLVASVLLACLPVFLFGLLEDLTHKVSPKWRMLGAAISGVFVVWLLGVKLPYLNIPYVDVLFDYEVVAWVVTVFFLAAIANAINIVDGYNGLVGGVVVAVAAPMAIVAYQVGDVLVLFLGLLVLAGMLGFLLFNFPFGRIFLGDGGAYLLGFLLGFMGIYLVANNPEVSAWFPALLLAYPVIETVFSMYRKKVLRGTSPAQPDGLHFHMLVHKRLVRWRTGSKQANDLLYRNSMTSPYLWVLCLFTAVPATLFWDNTLVLAIGFFVFALLYVWLYRLIVHFKMPRWLVISKSCNATAIVQAGTE